MVRTVCTDWVSLEGTFLPFPSAGRLHCCAAASYLWHLLMLPSLEAATNRGALKSLSSADRSSSCSPPPASLQEDGVRRTLSTSRQLEEHLDSRHLAENLHWQASCCPPPAKRGGPFLSSSVWWQRPGGGRPVQLPLPVPAGAASAPQGQPPALAQEREWGSPSIAASLSTLLTRLS